MKVAYSGLSSYTEFLTYSIWGKDDPIFSSDYIAKIKDSYGTNIRSIVIEDAQHTPNLEYPKIVNDKILEFLKL